MFRILQIVILLAVLQTGHARPGNPYDMEKDSQTELPLKGKTFLRRVDSVLTERYRKGDIDTAYLIRPNTKWVFKGRLNVSGAKIQAEGLENGLHFTSEMRANYKSTISIGVGYLGLSLNLALNPAKMMGKYSDFELNLNSYGKRFGFDFIYQNAHNFTGWHETEGQGRITLPADILSLKTLNVNAYYSPTPPPSRRATYSGAQPAVSCWQFPDRDRRARSTATTRRSSA